MWGNRKRGKYIGYLDSIDGLTVRGWAYNKENPQERVRVVVLVDGKPVAEGIADKCREDLKKAGIGDGCYGFEIKLPESLLDNKQHEVSVVVANTSTHLSNSPINIVLNPYIGNIDSLDKLIIKGWVIDTRNPNNKPTLFLYIDNKLVATTIANNQRPDLEKLNLGDGYHGFEIKIPDGNYIDTDEHTIKIVTEDGFVVYNKKVRFISPLSSFKDVYFNTKDMGDAILIPFPISRYVRITKDRRVFFTEASHTLASQIMNFLKENKIKILSLDIFDTLLLRGSECELERFFLWAKSIQEFDSFDVFLKRIIAHKEAYANASPGQDGTKEGDINLMFRNICATLNLTNQDDCFEILKNAEIQFEILNTYLNPALVNLIFLALKENIEIVLLTDTYLTTDFVKSILEQKFAEMNREFNNAITVYSSASLRLSKRQGGLFDLVIKTKNISPQEILHIGDNLNSDYKIPKTKGIHTLYMPISEEELKKRLESYYKFLENIQARVPKEFIKEYMGYFNP